MGLSSNPVTDRDLAPVAALVGDPTRVAMLVPLTEGHALPAGELARRAGVHPATATAHLHQLIAGGLIRVRAQGRHRYHELAGPEVAAVVGALAQLAPPAPVSSLRQPRAAAGLADLCAPHTQVGAGGDHLVTGLDDGRLSDAAFEPSAAQYPIAEFHHGVEREQYKPWLDQHAVRSASRLAQSSNSQLMAIVSASTSDGSALTRVSASAS